MTLKPLACTLIAMSLLSACSMAPTEDKKPNSPIIFTEPDLTAPFYALNPFNYDAPPPFEIALRQAAAQPVTKMEVNLQSDPSKKITLDSE